MKLYCTWHRVLAKEKCKPTYICVLVCINLFGSFQFLMRHISMIIAFEEQRIKEIQFWIFSLILKLSLWNTQSTKIHWASIHSFTQEDNIFNHLKAFKSLHWIYPEFIRRGLIYLKTTWAVDIAPWLSTAQHAEILGSIPSTPKQTHTIVTQKYATKLFMC